jgi:hypothetical protein
MYIPLISVSVAAALIVISIPLLHYASFSLLFRSWCSLLVVSPPLFSRFILSRCPRSSRSLLVISLPPCHFLCYWVSTPCVFFGVIFFRLVVPSLPAVAGYRHPFVLRPIIAAAAAFGFVPTQL